MSVDFAIWFRKRFAKEKGVPCLDCPDEKIVACSKLGNQGAPGCVRFQRYLGKSSESGTRKRRRKNAG